jgi:hypothetical protein
MSIGIFVSCFGHVVRLSDGETRSEGTHVLPVLTEIIVVLHFQVFCHENGFSGSFRFLGLATFFFSGTRFDACFLAHFIGLGQQRPLLPQPPTRAKASTPATAGSTSLTRSSLGSSARIRAPLPGVPAIPAPPAPVRAVVPSAGRIRLALCVAYVHLYGTWHSIVRHAHLPRSVRCSTKSRSL